MFELLRFDSKLSYELLVDFVFPFCHEVGIFEGDFVNVEFGDWLTLEHLLRLESDQLHPFYDLRACCP